MNNTRFSILAAGRIASFAVVYTILGLLIPIQGFLTLGFAIGTGIVGILYGITLYYLNVNMPLRRRTRMLITWFALYVIQMLNPVLEGIFFTTQFMGQPELALGAVVFGLILTLPTAIAASYLFNPVGDFRSFGDMRREYFAGWPSSQYAIRFVIASMLWLAIYFIIGSIIAPLVLPYYTDGSVGYNLTLPSIEIVILLQTVRGFIYAISFLPIVISTNLDKKKLALIMVGLLYVAGALAVFVISEQFPVFLRLIHGIELFVDSLIAGIVMAYVLGGERHPVDENLELIEQVELLEQIA
ncbi:MAG: hypothetical protein ACFFEA_06005 [Candidatus Thorarchaeota archaeon]